MGKKKPARARPDLTSPLAFTLTRTLPATAEEVDRALGDVMARLEACGDLYGEQEEIRLALREALNNALEHGCAQDPASRIVLTCRCDPQQGLHLVVRDQGPGFDPRSVPNPTEPENIEALGGRGLYIMRKLMDEVEFRAQGREVHLRRRPRR